MALKSINKPTIKDRFVAQAAPASPISKPKINNGSSTTFSRLVITITLPGISVSP